MPSVDAAAAAAAAFSISPAAAPDSHELLFFPLLPTVHADADSFAADAADAAGAAPVAVLAAAGSTVCSACGFALPLTCAPFWGLNR